MVTRQETGALLDGRRIMVVEDEAILALDLALSLADEGGEVVGPFHRLSAAMHENLDDVDGVVLDLALNGKTAHPLAEKLRAHDIPTLIHTGQWPLDTSYPQGEVCAKPCLMERLVRRLSALLAASGETEANGAFRGRGIRQARPKRRLH